MTDRRVFLHSLVAAGFGALAGVRIDARGGAASGPADVLLMRHAEEPAHGPHLDARGRERADALITLFPARFPKPTAIFAARSTKASARPVETIQPLAHALGLTVDDTFGEEMFKKVARKILNDAAFAGGHVLVCWHRETMGPLAEALGVSNPPRLKAVTYDHVWLIQFADGHARLRDESERLLNGDA